MIDKDLCKYASLNWQNYLITISKASENDHEKPMVESDIKIYNFDKIIEDLFSNAKPPCSVDGVRFKKNTIQFIEFKSGFKQKINKNTFDENKATCEDTKKICDKFWNIFAENQKRKINQLIDSIKMKAVESYMTLEKKILPQCDGLETAKKLIFLVVVDVEGADGIEDMLADVAEIEPNSENSIQSIKQSLERFVKQKDAKGQDYLYDEIKVCSAIEYQLEVSTS